jgi:mRNA interferase RelE/StbE
LGRGDVKQLADRAGFRLRIGSYRVIFDEDKTTILAIYIGKRETTTYRRN